MRTIILNGVTLPDTYQTGYRLVTVSPITKEHRLDRYYNTAIGEAECNRLADDINTICNNGDEIIIIASYGAISINKKLRDALARAGGMPTGIRTVGRYAHAFVGRSNMGAGNGFEDLEDDSDSRPTAEISTRIYNRQIEGSHAAEQAQYLTEAMKQDTTIEGGLISTSVINLGTTESGTRVDRAGVNGLRGVGESEVRFWAGASFANRHNAPFFIRQNGTGQLAAGNIIWDSSGNLSLKGIINALNGGRIGNFDILNGEIIGKDSAGIQRLKLTTVAIPALGSLGNQAWTSISSLERHTFEGYYDGGDRDDGQGATNYREFTYDNNVSIPALSRVRAYISDDYISHSNPASVGSVSVSCVVQFYNGNTLILTLQNGQEAQLPQNITRISYAVILTVQCYRGFQTTSYLDVSAEVQRQNENTSQSAIGSDGLFSYWGSGNYFYFQKNYGFEVRAGSGGIRISTSGLQKWNGSTWVAL